LRPKPDNSRRPAVTRSGFPAAIQLGAVLCAIAYCLAAPPSAAQSREPLRISDAQLEPVPWSDLGGWAADDHRAAFLAWRASCQALHKRGRPGEEGAIEFGLREVCQRAVAVRPETEDGARKFFEQNFYPVRIGRLGEHEGLLTGYYEPVVQGSRFPSPEYHFPIYRRPRDLVAVGHERGAFPNSGALVGRRNQNGEIVPYYDRAAIEAGALDGQKLEICWLRDAFDVVNIQIQGSARVILEDGTPVRVNYDAHNGHPYGSIGRVLIERNLIPRDEMSMERIREWMMANPDEAPKIRAANRAYVFFRITGLSNDGNPVGAQGVPLTPGRSIAVDKMHVYGTPFFIEASLPVESAKASPFHRLMIAQDTGSAIVGPARADLFWGAGDEAGRLAGRMRHPGRFVMLLPRELDMTAAGREMPLPLPKPNLIVPDVTPTHETAVPLPVPKPKFEGQDPEKAGQPVAAGQHGGSRPQRRAWRWQSRPAPYWSSW
jgi:membrane-bound lytic murein transglycosylase A